MTRALSDKPGVPNRAGKGSLFRDELGENQRDMQIKLLRFQGGNGYRPAGGVEVLKPDIGLIAATGRKGRQLLENRRIRQVRFRQEALQFAPGRCAKTDGPKGRKGRGDG